MIKVECESCQAPYQIDPKRVPPTGLKMRCPKCGHSFVVASPGGAAPVAAALPQQPSLKATAVGGINFDSPFADLPSAAPAKEKPGFGTFGFGDLGDLGGLDLPSASKSRDDFPAKIPARPAGGFGDVDLPSKAGASAPSDLPVPVRGGPSNFGFGAADLPAPRGAADLPSPARGVDLPSPAGVDLPVRSRGVDLPSPKGFGDFGSLDLPSPPAAELPSPKGFGDFGEVSLPSNLDSLPVRSNNVGFPAVPAPASSAAGLGFDFGEFDLPPAPEASPLSTGLPPISASAYGSGDDLSLEMAAPLPHAAMPMPIEPSIDLAPSVPVRPLESLGAGRLQQSPRSQKRLKALGAFAVVLLGGSLMQLTPLGAFGHLAIIDAVSKGKYQRFADEGLAELKAASTTDLYVPTRDAADHLHERHVEAPRAPRVTELAGIAEYMYQVRFGADGGRATRAEQDIAAIPVEKRSALYNGAQAAAQGNNPSALAYLRAATGEDEWAGACLVGEITLRTRDLAAATVAFNRALALGFDVKANFGLARIAYAKGDANKAKEALAKVFAKSPKHAEAHILAARVALELDQDQTAATAHLADFIAPNAKESLGVLAAADARSLAGFLALASGKTQAAKDHFDAATKLQPQNVTALLGLGELLYADARYTEAQGRFDAAVLAAPTNVAAIVGAAKTKVGLERLADAKTQLVAALKTSPTAWPLHLWLGRTEEALGNKSEAEKQYRAALDSVTPKDSDAITPYVALASLLASQGRAEDAEAKLQEAKSKLPPSAAMDRAFAEVAAAQGKYETALSFLGAAREKNPDDAQTTFRLGVTLRRMRRLSEAGIEFEHVAEKEPEFPGLALERGLLFEESGDIDKALNSFKTALAKAPNDLDLQLRVGAAYVAANKPKDAMPLLQKVLAARPNSAEVNHYLARAYLAMGGSSLPNAMRHAKRSVELDPNRAEYHLYVAWIANETTPPALGTAKEAVDRALALDGLLADAFWQRGVVEQREAKVLDAQADLLRALELKPGRLEAHATLAESLEDQNKPEAALGEWAKAIAASNAQPYWHFRYGRLLAEHGRSGDALGEFDKAFTAADALDPRPGWLASAAFGSAELLRKSGKRAEAVARYKRYLEVAPANSPDRTDAENALRGLGAK